jgi:hypothetical protein
VNSSFTDLEVEGFGGDSGASSTTTSILMLLPSKTTESSQYSFVSEL